MIICNHVANKKLYIDISKSLTFLNIDISMALHETHGSLWQLNFVSLLSSCKTSFFWLRFHSLKTLFKIFILFLFLFPFGKAWSLEDILDFYLFFFECCSEFKPGEISRLMSISSTWAHTTYEAHPIYCARTLCFVKNKKALDSQIFSLIGRTVKKYNVFQTLFWTPTYM